MTEDEIVVVWADFMSITSLVLLVLLPPIFWYHRHEKLIAARLPVMCIAEFVVDLLLLFLVASQYGNMAAMWDPCPCFILNALSSAPNQLVFNITMARIVLFYRLAQTSVWAGKKNPYMEKLVFWMGYLNAPREFLRLENRLQHLQNQSIGLSSIGTGNSAPQSESYKPNIFGSSDLLSRVSALMPSIASLANSEASGKSRSPKEEWLDWAKKLGIWFFFWSVLSLIVTVPVDKGALFEPVRIAFDYCSFTVIYFIGAHLIMWNILQLVIVSLCLNMVNDSLGLKTELIIIQSIFSVTWGLDGVLQAFFPYAYLAIGIWADLSTMLLHALITFGYPVGLVYYRRYQRRKISDKHLAMIKTPQDFELFWATAQGKAILLEIAQKHLAVESVLFLHDCDDLLNAAPAHVKDKYVKLNKKFIEFGSPFEMNLPSEISRPCAESIKKETFSHDPIKHARDHVVKMLIDNFKVEIAEAFTEGSTAYNFGSHRPIKSSQV